METSVTQVRATPFPRGKRIAVTTSWDDAVVEDRWLVEQMNKVGLKGTFNINSAQLAGPNQELPTGWGQRIAAREVANLYRGHEVAIHSRTHPHLTKVSPDEVRWQIVDDRKALEDLVGYPVRGMAYPFGDYNAAVIKILRELGVEYARTCENRDPCFPPAEPLAWASTAFHIAKDVPERWQKFYNDPASTGVFFLWGHAFEFSRDGWDLFPKTFGPIAGHADVWYCTNIELFDYEAARKRLVIASNGKSVYNPSAIVVTVAVGDRLVEVEPGKVTAWQ